MCEFVNRGGYGAFVWPCFALAAIVLVRNVWKARSLHVAAKERALRRPAEGRGKV